MTTANVSFLDLDGETCPEGQKPARFSFDCVGHNRGKDPRLPRTPCAELLIAEGKFSAAHGIMRDPDGSHGGRPQWDWDGNRKEPTFSPSINCGAHCGWHGYIRGGRCVEPSGEESK